MRCACLIAFVCGAGCSTAEKPGGSGGNGAPVDFAVAGDGGIVDDDLGHAGGGDAAVPAIQHGVLVGGTGAHPGAIEGVPFRSGAISGVTDAQGTFSYETGQPITFTVGNVTTVAAPGAAQLSPFQLAGATTCGLSQAVKNLVVLLYSLDGDHDPATGTHLPAFAAAGAPIALASLTPAQLAGVITTLAPGTTPMDEMTAVHHFIRQVDGEVWQEASMETFSATLSAQRSQGVATDGQKWLFSWRLGLETADAAFNELTANQLAIPLQLSAQGSDHIGDIDYYNGKIYAPVEDSKNYAHPTILLYDATSLAYANVSYALPQPLQTKGVPWVAVDGPRGKVVTAEWDPTPSLNLFDLNGGLATLGSLPLSVTLGRIQGAKVYQSMLYANADDAQKTTYKINLESGTVMPLFSSGRTDVEAEGLALWAVGGALLHTLNTNAAKTAMELHHHKRTRDPLRLSLCP